MAPLDTKPSNAPKGVWKSGKGKGRHTPKGRQFSDEAQAEIAELEGERTSEVPVRREHGIDLERHDDGTEDDREDTPAPRGS